MPKMKNEKLNKIKISEILKNLLVRWSYVIEVDILSTIEIMLKTR